MPLPKFVKFDPSQKEFKFFTNSNLHIGSYIITIAGTLPKYDMANSVNQTWFKLDVTCRSKSVRSEKASIDGNFRLGTTDAQDFIFDEFIVFPECDATQQALSYSAKLAKGGSLPPQVTFDS